MSRIADSTAEPEKRAVVVCIHGILGTPRQFDALTAELEGLCDVIAPWLPGHGGNARAFGKSTMAAWQDAVDQVVSDAIARYARVYLVGHSMGGLLLAEAAGRDSNVRGLLLIAMPLRFRFTPHALRNCLRVSCTQGPCTARAMCGVRPRPLGACFLWPPRYEELFRKARCVRKLLPELHMPVRCFYFARDELCAPASVRLLPSGWRAEILPRSRHAEWDAAETRRMAQPLRRWLAEEEP